MVRAGHDDGDLAQKNQLEGLKSGKCLQNLFSSAKEMSISAQLT